jgi:mono/diheme cytochrome c family protein
MIICSRQIVRVGAHLTLCCQAAWLVGCQQKMAEQPSYKPLDGCSFFADGRSARAAVPGTVARGHLQVDKPLYTGRRDRPAAAEPAPPNRSPDREAMPLIAAEAEAESNFVETFPLPITASLIEHGYHRYMIFCVVCHDPLGTGHGKIVERGYTRPPSYHIERLRNAPVGRLFAVATEGYGSMPSYAEQISVTDRWAIVAYIRALQLSQHYPKNKLPAKLPNEWTSVTSASGSGGMR